MWLNGELIEEQYPIPIIYCTLQGKRVEFGIDVAQNEEYIGYLKFHLLNETLTECHAIYGDENPFYRDGFVLPEVSYKVEGFDSEAEQE